MSTQTVPVPTGRVLPPVFRRRPVHVVERNALSYRRMWFIFLTGFFEPLMYLGSIGLGVGALVGYVVLPGGERVPYEQFVAPGLFAAAAMNGSVFDTTFNFFVKYKYSHTYDAMLATPMSILDVVKGEVAWALIRGSLYAAAFLGTMAGLGLVDSWWGLAALPVAVLMGYAFAGAGLGATTFMRSFVDFDFVNLAIVPLFLFSAVFFPLSRYPDAVQWLVQVTPLYQGVVLTRGLVLGDLSWGMVGHVAYLAALGTAGMLVAARRLSRLLQP